jgi:hypothetical protein
VTLLINGLISYNPFVLEGEEKIQTSIGLFKIISIIGGLMLIAPVDALDQKHRAKLA